MCCVGLPALDASATFEFIGSERCCAKGDFTFARSAVHQVCARVLNPKDRAGCTQHDGDALCLEDLRLGEKRKA